MASPCFAEVLDDALAQAAARARRTVAWSAAATAQRYSLDPWSWRGSGVAAPIVQGATSPLAVPRSVARSIDDTDSPAPTDTATNRVLPASPSTPPRRLTADQRWALARLRALGARLTEAFTAEQLRCEYRRVVLRCHPDRHHDASADALAQLAAQFAHATAAYRLLRSAV